MTQSAVPTRATAGRVAINEAGLFVRGLGADAPAVLVHFDDQHIWSFTPGADGQPGRGGTSIAWPAVLQPYLDGTTRVRLANLDGSVVYCDEEHRFGAGAGRVRFVDRAGHPLAVDKMGHLTRSFESTPDAVKREILEGTQVVIRELRERCGVEAFLGYGALLGAVREGGMIAHDSDTDVCYFSRHTDPADIILETFRIERDLKELGWEVLRMSGGDLKVIWPLSDGRRVHIDIFSSFFVGDVFYVLGNRSGELDLADLLPLGTVDLDGHEFPAPRNPEALLVYWYGPSWRVPDPAYTPAEDPHAMVRLDGWLRGFRQGMSGWTPLLRGSSRPDSKLPTGGSEFAAWVHGQIGPEEAVLDLGAGNGRDSIWFAAQGHPVRSSDYSRRSAVEVRGLMKRSGITDVRPRQVILNETRHVFHLIALLSREPHHIYARQLVGCLDAAARENLFRLGASVLRGGQSMWLEFAVPHPGAAAPEPVGLVTRFDPDVLTGEIERSGGRVVSLEVAPGVDMFDNPDPAVARMRVTWRAGQSAETADVKESV
ncbi:class I SAM-dependent methyltransferase [Nocardioides sp. CER19]|uniref:class I SAM-dependent methyltransferase n=1 Tax=Nocardioides sp. CER19 TaxID=3038538 RepID=UPI002446A9BC|nr:class I SAM-dependent methyltransferase [Nocardioides sp. CER19]MDH2414784.1 class I SAM-dependent methyltransferase [Nocardioides sp. CER19]